MSWSSPCSQGVQRCQKQPLNSNVGKWLIYWEVTIQTEPSSRKERTARVWTERRTTTTKHHHSLHCWYLQIQLKHGNTMRHRFIDDKDKNPDKNWTELEVVYSTEWMWWGSHGPVQPNNHCTRKSTFLRSGRQKKEKQKKTKSFLICSFF